MQTMHQRRPTALPGPPDCPHLRLFDTHLSLRLDACIARIDAAPGPLCRIWLRFQKRRLERHVPAYQPRTRGQ